MVASATNNVWTEISSFLNWRISKNALHTFVHQGRHGVKEKLGISTEKYISTPTVCEKNYFYDTGLYFLKINEN